MSAVRGILMRTFGRPTGLLGWLGGTIMARSNRKCAAWVIELLQVQSDDAVLEIGFGPGVGIQLLARSAAAGLVVGVDASEVMVAQARARNARAIETGRVDLRYGTVESLPFQAQTFDKALAINSMQVWPDPVAGLEEIRRVLRPNGRLALGFTPHSGQAKDGLPDLLTTAGFAEVRLVEGEPGFCILVTRL
jgi:ubiquinone/menaquinone biosynthesis C-methylase UbiE